MLTDTDPEDALSELGEDEPSDETMPEPSTFLVIQEGGSSQELYTHVFDSRDDAEGYRTSSADEGSYRTSSPIEVPLSLADHPAFGCVAEAIAKGAVSVDFPEDD